MQGVGFRWFVREQARALGLAGLVRNEEDGAVRVIVTGTDQGIDRLEVALRAGPRGALVEAVTRELSGEPRPSCPYPFMIDR